MAIRCWLVWILSFSMCMIDLSNKWNFFPPSLLYWLATFFLSINYQRQYRYVWPKKIIFNWISYSLSRYCCLVHTHDFLSIILFHKIMYRSKPIDSIEFFIVHIIYYNHWIYISLFIYFCCCCCCFLWFLFKIQKWKKRIKNLPLPLNV